MTTIRQDTASHRDRSATLLAVLIPMAAIVAVGCGRGSGETTVASSDSAPEAVLVSTLETFGDEVDDAILGLRVRMQLLEHLEAEALGVDIGVTSGEVVLSGTVDEPASRSLANEVAQSVDGVGGVTNLIQVPANDHRRPIERAVGVAEREVSDALLLTRIKLRLVRELGSSALDIDVDVKDGQVSLRGSLPDSERKSLAVETAEAVKGVGEVHDLLDVQL